MTPGPARRPPIPPAALRPASFGPNARSCARGRGRAVAACRSRRSNQRASRRSFHAVGSAVAVRTERQVQPASSHPGPPGAGVDCAVDRRGLDGAIRRGGSMGTEVRGPARPRRVFQSPPAPLADPGRTSSWRAGVIREAADHYMSWSVRMPATIAGLSLGTQQRVCWLRALRSSRSAAGEPPRSSIR